MSERDVYRLRFPVQTYWSDKENCWLVSSGTMNRIGWVIDVPIPLHVLAAEEALRVAHKLPPLVPKNADEEADRAALAEKHLEESINMATRHGCESVALGVKHRIERRMLGFKEPEVVYPKKEGRLLRSWLALKAIWKPEEEEDGDE